MLGVSYDPASQTAHLDVTDSSPGWESIRRAIMERCESAVTDGPTSLTVSWWEFLSCREAIAYHATRAEIEVEFTKPAEGQLQAALERQAPYNRAASQAPLSEKDVLKGLRAGGFDRDLTVEQMRNLRKLGAFAAGADFSVPGAGKTSVALAFFVLKGGSEKRLLVVAPKNAFAAWEEQLQECFSRKKPGVFSRLTGGREQIASLLRREKPRLMLITYHQLNTARDIVAAYLASAASLVFLDESHRMKKGQGGPLGQSALSISHLPDAKLVLSGTPMPNSTQDLVPQFDFLYPEVRADADSVVDLIQPIYARTTKEELGLPNPLVKPIRIPLAPGQRVLYDALRSDESRKLLNLKANERTLLRAAGKSAMRLLQVVSNPGLLTGVASIPEGPLLDAINEGGSPKLEYVCARARELAKRNQKVVIWSSFVPNVELIAARLVDLGADYIHGGVAAGDEDEDDTREGKIRAFHDQDDKMVLVANPAACGEGISLHTVCHHAIYLDRTYNAAQYLQSRDRIHRLGLPPNVKTRIEVVLSPGTIDELVDDRLRQKIQRMAKVLNDPGLFREVDAGDPDDIEDLNLTLDDLDGLMQHLRS